MGKKRVDRQTFQVSRSYAPRGNAVKARCAPSHDQRFTIRDAARPARRSHAARGNEELTVFRRYLYITMSALRGNPVRGAPASRTAERFRLHSHAERGNDELVITDRIQSLKARAARPTAEVSKPGAASENRVFANPARFLR